MQKQYDNTNQQTDECYRSDIALTNDNQQASLAAIHNANEQS
jgi:hypothetical protein